MPLKVAMPLRYRRAPIVLAAFALALGVAFGAWDTRATAAPIKPGVLAASPLAAPTARPLSPEHLAQAEDFRAKMLTWTRELDRVFPALSQYAEPGHEHVLDELESTLEGLAPGDVLILEGEMANHPAFWELPRFIESMYNTQVPVPPYYTAAMLEWADRGLVDHAMAKRLAVDVDRAARAQMTAPGGTGLELAPRGPGLIAPPGSPADPNAVPTPDPTAEAPFPTMPEFPPRTSLPDPGEREGCPGIFTGNMCSQCATFIPTAAIYAIKFGVIAASAATSVFDPDTDVCFPLVCTCISFPTIPYYVANSIKIALQAVHRGLEFNNALAAFCEDGLMWAIADTFLDTTVSSRVTQDSLDAHGLLELRLQIENNLLRQADDRISDFQLPSNICGDGLPDQDGANMTGYEGFRFCGKLEFVREIVAEAIDQNALAGMLIDVNKARAELDAGDVHYMLGNYKSAYERYSTAYRAAVQPESRR